MILHSGFTNSQRNRIGWNLQMILLDYGQRFRSMRKWVKEFIGTKSAVAQFRSLHEREARYFLSRVLANSENIADNIRL